MAVQPCLCGTWSETPRTGFLTTRLNLNLSTYNIEIIEPGRYSIQHLLSLTGLLGTRIQSGFESETKSLSEEECAFDDI